jgi:hypothetical protein
VCSVNLRNACEILEFSNMCGASQLKATCLQFIIINISALLELRFVSVMSLSPRGFCFFNACCRASGEFYIYNVQPCKFQLQVHVEFMICVCIHFWREWSGDRMMWNV